jgi:glycyl-tRNA synthetase
VALKNNIKQNWWKKFVDSRRDMYGVDAAILMRQEVWQASGHVAGFADPMVECEKCHAKFRADQIEDKNKCANCGGKLGEAKQFNMMFKTKVGASDDSSATSYLRPETAQGMFVNFKNTVDAFHPKLPFGMAQIGKAFRNEITPRDFVFRAREFEQMEIEYFIRSADWEKYFDYWKGEMLDWMEEVGIDMSKVHELEVAKEDRAHYSSRTVDFEFDFPFGRKELFGLAYRTDFDLKQHKLEYIDEENAEKMVPHVIEPTFGVDRAVLTILLSAYTEDEQGGEVRSYLKLKPSIAPVICAVSPLLKNKIELVEYANEKVYAPLKAEFGRVAWDDNGNIGKRYRRQDEIGTPFCVVVDFDTLTDDAVTVRDRDTGKQERIKVSELIDFIKNKIS